MRRTANLLLPLIGIALALVVWAGASTLVPGSGSSVSAQALQGWLFPDNADFTVPWYGAGKTS